jgi:putative Holliday junction resolvase
VLHHIARPVDAAAIAQLAAENQAGLIVVGQALNADNEPNPQGRRAARLAEALRLQTDLPVVLWDESGSTQAVRAAQAAMGTRLRKRRSHLDELAATYILQTYLDSHAADSP